MLCGGRRRYCVLERGLQQHFLLLLILKEVQVVLAVILSSLQFVAAGVCGICRHVKSCGIVCRESDALDDVPSGYATPDNTIECLSALHRSTPVVSSLWR